MLVDGLRYALRVLSTPYCATVELESIKQPIYAVMGVWWPVCAVTGTAHSTPYVRAGGFPFPSRARRV